MELTVTQPVFLWIFGIFGVLSIILLIFLVIIFMHIARLMHLANEKAADIASTIDEVRSSIHATAQAINDTRDRITNFVTFTTSAAGIAKLVGSIRESWASRHPAHDDLFDKQPPKRSKKK